MIEAASQRGSCVRMPPQSERRNYTGPDPENGQLASTAPATTRPALPPTCVIKDWQLIHNLVSTPGPKTIGRRPIPAPRLTLRDGTRPPFSMPQHLGAAASEPCPPQNHSADFCTDLTPKLSGAAEHHSAHNAWWRLNHFIHGASARTQVRLHST